MFFQCKREVECSGQDRDDRCTMSASRSASGMRCAVLIRCLLIWALWINASPVQLEQSQIKRSRRLKQKKKAQIRNEHTHPNANGALISRTSSADFPHGIDGIEPFVSMSPANDSDETHGLIMSILEHRIDSIIIENCTSVNDEQKKRLVLRERQLLEKFIFMNRFTRIGRGPIGKGWEM